MAEGVIDLTIVTPERSLVHEQVDELEIPGSLDYARIAGLSNEVVQKLGRVRPRTIGQAARIPGVTPAAVSILLMAALRD